MNERERQPVKQRAELGGSETMRMHCLLLSLQYLQCIWVMRQSNFQIVNDLHKNTRRTQIGLLLALNISNAQTYIPYMFLSLLWAHIWAHTFKNIPQMRDFWNMRSLNDYASINDGKCAPVFVCLFLSIWPGWELSQVRRPRSHHDCLSQMLTSSASRCAEPGDISFRWSGIYGNKWCTEISGWIRCGVMTVKYASLSNGHVIGFSVINGMHMYWDDRIIYTSIWPPVAATLNSARWAQNRKSNTLNCPWLISKWIVPIDSIHWISMNHFTRFTISLITYY